MASDFQRELNSYLQAKENEDAFDLVLDELAVCMLKDRQNFVDVLNNAGVPASVDDSDVVLIEKFTQNAVANQRLLVGAAMLVNHENPVSNFDGEDELSDVGVKNTYHVLQSNFIGDTEEYSEIAPFIAAGAKAIVGGARAKREEKKIEAEQKMMQKAIEQKRIAAAKQAKKRAEEKRKMNNVIIIGSILTTVALLGGIIYLSRTK